MTVWKTLGRLQLMKPVYKGLIVVAVLATVLWFLWREYYDFLSRGQRPPESTQILNEMEKDGPPDFTLPDLDGKSVSRSEFAGKIVIVNFWASWCEPCVREFPSLKQLVDQFHGDVILLAVSADSNEQDIRTFLKALDLESPNVRVLWDKDQSVAKKYGTFKLPESYLIGPKGQLLRKVSGVEDWMTPDAQDYFREMVTHFKAETGP